MFIKYKKRIYTSIILIFIILLQFNYEKILVYSLIILSVLAIVEFINISKKIFKNYFYSLFSNIFFSIYIFLFCLLFLILSKYLFSKILIFTLLFGCIASDVGGFVIGKSIKGPKLTKISPKKTVSGSLGSFFFTIVTTSILMELYTEIYFLNVIFLGFITSLFCQLGDLFFSFLKRKAKIKDTGNFLPGHGGILDRLDGILFGIPAGLFFLIIIN